MIIPLFSCVAALFDFIASICLLLSLLVLRCLCHLANGAELSFLGSSPSEPIVFFLFLYFFISYCTVEKKLIMSILDDTGWSWTFTSNWAKIYCASYLFLGLEVGKGSLSYWYNYDTGFPRDMGFFGSAIQPRYLCLYLIWMAHMFERRSLIFFRASLPLTYDFNCKSRKFLFDTISTSIY